LEQTAHWRHRNLTLYVDDGAIYAVSATTKATTRSAIEGFEMALQWLDNNGLSADPAKTKLMIFNPSRQPNLMGGTIYGAQYSVSNTHHNITMVTSLHYLGVFLTAKLDWTKHVSIMVNCAHSTIHGIS